MVGMSLIGEAERLFHQAQFQKISASRHLEDQLVVCTVDRRERRRVGLNVDEQATVRGQRAQRLLKTADDFLSLSDKGLENVGREHFTVATERDLVPGEKKD